MSDSDPFSPPTEFSPMSKSLDKPPRNVTETEHGGTVTRSPEEVDLALKVLILNGGDSKNASLQLAAEGIKVNRDQLAGWRDVKFPRRYAELRRNISGDVSEEMAGRALERALESDAAQQRYIELALEKVEEVEPNHLAKNAMALSNVMSTNVEKAQLLRNEPTEIRRVDVEDSLRVLERLEVAWSIEGEAEEIEDAEVVG